MIPVVGVTLQAGADEWNAMQPGEEPPSWALQNSGNVITQATTKAGTDPTSVLNSIDPDAGSASPTVLAPAAPSASPLTGPSVESLTLASSGTLSGVPEPIPSGADPTYARSLTAQNDTAVTLSQYGCKLCSSRKATHPASRILTTR